MHEWLWLIGIVLQLAINGFMLYKCLHNGAIDNDHFGLCLITGVFLVYEGYRVVMKLRGVNYPITDARLAIYRFEHVVYGAFWYGEVYPYVKKTFSNRRRG